MLELFFLQLAFYYYLFQKIILIKQNYIFFAFLCLEWSPLYFS
ncbi:hypothetical protein XOC_4063 [Xanthomonas oryzae pv. oryzicola BLS256]|uniref:Uncharacterized protein n=1 Tax=Xanthomonas oryzae pv. oryzicola (strain BLS256) TaxID=383407 RepID=G7TIN5_XANOB|nr:hypothetical protein XOC_4063 [Xanthomonas oryzae pv. oryzicola BLS256]